MKSHIAATMAAMSFIVRQSFFCFLFPRRPLLIIIGQIYTNAWPHARRLGLFVHSTVRQCCRVLVLRPFVCMFGCGFILIAPARIQSTHKDGGRFIGCFLIFFKTIYSLSNGGWKWKSDPCQKRSIPCCQGFPV